MRCSGGRGAGAFVIIGLAVALAVGCASDARTGSGITLATLSATTGNACAVPLDVVASSTGLDTSTPASGSVVDGRLADHGSIARFPATDAEAVDGVAVSCALVASDGASVELTLLAGKSGDAGMTVLPQAAYAAGLDTDQAEQLANDVSRTKVGALVPVPGTAAVAVMPTKVSGASTAVILLSSAGLTRGQLEQLARLLDERLQ